MAGKKKIWCNAELPSEVMALLQEGVGRHELVFAGSRGNNLAAAQFSTEMEGAEVAFGQPDPGQVIASSSLKFVQITSAGYTRYDTDSFRGHVRGTGLLFCNSSSVFAEPCAQHLLAFMLAQVRQIPASAIAQSHDSSWIYDRLRSITRVLRGDKVLILGYGTIGQRLVELLAPFQLQLTALRRNPKGDEPVPTFPIGDLSRHLVEADHVIDILPANDSTTRLLNRDRFAEMKPAAIFYNIGRGTTVDQSALVEALRSGHLAAALLDVTDPEPLPPDHPLWKTPNCTITPHIAGGFLDEPLALVKHFLENLRRYETDSPLTDLVFGLSRSWGAGVRK